MSNRCIECDGIVKVNYSCYDDIYICNECESCYYDGNYELNSILFPDDRKILGKI